MTTSLDLEKSFRGILKDQLRELVARSVPESDRAHRERISTLLDNMINAWVNAGPQHRPLVLAHWMEKIKSYVEGAKIVRRVKTGRSVAVSSRFSPHIPGKAANPVTGGDENLPFNLVEAKLPVKDRPRGQIKFGGTEGYEVRSERIAELLNLSKSRVELIRNKLRKSGLDVGLLNARYIGAALKSSGDPTVRSKAPHRD